MAAGKTPHDVAQQFATLASKIRAALPNARIAFISINPTIKRAAGEDEVRATNARIENLVHGKSYLRFIISHDGLLGTVGRARKVLLRDVGLHFSTQGYQEWLRLAKPSVLEFYREAALPAH